VGGDRPHWLDDFAPVRSGDLFLTFCYTQDPALVARLLALMGDRGAVTVVVTGTPDPNLYRRADHHLFVPRGQWNFKNSMAAPMAFAQILLLAVEFLGGPDLHHRLEALETARKGYGSGKEGEES
jgi:DNA-binding MurR/RpiR family transcriptional regulator